jgi:hypothetical protein
MVTFSVPHNKDFFNFSVDTGRVLFAGSRNLFIPRQICNDLIYQFGRLGFAFLTGCAKGVDESFRHALAESDFKDTSIVACAFKDRAERLKGVYPLYVVPDGLHPKAALAKRTLWMTSRCSLLILFPSNPIGRGSALAFKSAIYNNKPVFVITSTRPEESDLYSVYPSSLFGVVEGFWCVPPVYAETGLCYEVV